MSITVGAVLGTIAGISAIGIAMNAIHAEWIKRKTLRQEPHFEEGQRLMITQKIVKYKGQSGRRAGKFLAYRDFGTDDRVFIGFAVCNPTDRYNRDEEHVLAYTRAVECYENPLRIPKGLEEEFLAFYDRCERYFGEGYLPTNYFLFNNQTEKYDAVTVDSYLYNDGEDDDRWHREYYFDVTEPETYNGIQLHEDCEPDH